MVVCEEGTLVATSAAPAAPKKIITILGAAAVDVLDKGQVRHHKAGKHAASAVVVYGLRESPSSLQRMKDVNTARTQRWLCEQLQHDARRQAARAARGRQQRQATAL